MKRFSLGFMNSISSSYEVEISDDDSGTSGGSLSVDFDSYSTTEDDHKSASCMTLGSSVYYSDYSSKHESSTCGSSTCNDDTDTITTGRDQKSNSSIDLRSGYNNTKKMRSEVSSNTTDISLSSSVSKFLSAVDRTVDAVVDSLIPLEEDVDTSRAKQPFTQRSFAQPEPNGMKRSNSFIISRSSQVSRKSENEEDVVFTNGLASTITMLSMSFKKDTNNQPTKKVADDDIFHSLRSSLGFSSSPQIEPNSESNGKKKATKAKHTNHDNQKKKTKTKKSEKAKGSKFKWKTKQNCDETRDDNDRKANSSSKRFFRVNKKKQEEITKEENKKEEESVFEYFKSMFIPGIESSENEKAKKAESRKKFQFGKNKKKTSDSNRSPGKKKGFGFITN